MPAMIDVLAKYGYTYARRGRNHEARPFGITGKDAQIPEDQHEAILATVQVSTNGGPDDDLPGRRHAGQHNRPGTSLAKGTSKLGAELRTHRRSLPLPRTKTAVTLMTSNTVSRPWT